MLAKEADRWAGEEERGGGVGWRDKTGGVFFLCVFFSGWRRQDFAGDGRGESTQGGKTMLVGGGRVRCAVCADESFSFKKRFLGAALEAELISLFVLNLSGWSQR